MIVNTNSPTGKKYMERAKKNAAFLTTGPHIHMCPTQGQCLNRAWVIQNKGPWTIPVGMWKPTGKPDEYEVMSVDVCASKECRLPVTAVDKVKIDNYLENFKLSPREELDALDYLLEGL